MSLPAALTWLQLLPSGTQFSCAHAPAWFEEMLREHAGGGIATSRAMVTWDTRWSELAAELPKHDAVVGINCPQVTPARLEFAGCAYARRFAVLPSLEHARWFICLDTGATAAASFSLYTPSRKSAHVKKAVARMLAKLRVPGWYRDEIIVAARDVPPLERKLAELFPDRIVRLALSSGAPEPAINRKPSASVIAEDGSVLAFAKIAVSKVSREIVEHEAEMLAGLAALQRSGVAAPRLLFAGVLDGRYITVQSPLQGAPAPAALTDAHRAFLRALACGPEKMASETRMVALLPQRLDALRPPRPDLRELFDAILPLLDQTPITSTIVHGDFAPWNLRTHHGTISAFDWEYGETDGLPLIDQIHFRLQLGLEMRKWDVDEAALMLEKLSPSDGWNNVRAAQVVYLLDHLARLLGEGYPREHDLVSLYERLLARVARVARVARAALPAREAALA